MKTSAEGKAMNYQVNRYTGPMGSSISTSYSLPDSFRTVDNTEVEVIDLILDDNGNIIDPPKFDNSAQATSLSSSLNTDVPNQAVSPTNNSTNSSTPVPEVLDEGNVTLTEEVALAQSSPTNNSTNQDGKNDIGSIVGKGNQPIGANGENTPGSEVSGTNIGRLGATGIGNGIGVNPQVNIDSIEFSGDLKATGDDNSSSSSNNSSGSSETTSSSHKQTDSLAYYSNDWISIFDAYADMGYNSILDSNYFNNAYASTGAKLSKNAKSAR